MTIALHNTQDWPADKVMGYGPDLTAAMFKLRDRFPNDISVPVLMQDIVSGARQLWLVLDDEAFVSFVLTEIKTIVATSHKVVVVTDVAGGGGPEQCSLMPTIEEWARDIGAREVRLVGRLGWRKALAREGYQVDLMTYTKAIAA